MPIDVPLFRSNSQHNSNTSCWFRMVSELPDVSICVPCVPCFWGWTWNILELWFESTEFTWMLVISGSSGRPTHTGSQTVEGCGFMEFIVESLFAGLQFSCLGLNSIMHVRTWSLSVEFTRKTWENQTSQDLRGRLTDAPRVESRLQEVSKGAASCGPRWWIFLNLVKSI